MNNIIKQQVIGIDVGVEKTSLALVDLRGTILAQDAMNTKDYPSVSSFVEALSERDGLYRKCGKYALEGRRTTRCYVA